MGMRTDVFNISPMMTTNVASDDELGHIGAVLSEHHIVLAVGGGGAQIDSAVRLPGECGFGVEGMITPWCKCQHFQAVETAWPRYKIYCDG